MIELALAAVVGSVIGMAAILWDLHDKLKHEQRLSDFWRKEFNRMYRVAKDYAKKSAEAREKLRPYQRTHGKNGKFNGKV